MKQCFKCGETKDIDAFYPHPKMADGHLNKCKECTKQDGQLNRRENPLRIHLYEKQRGQRPERKQAQKSCSRERKFREPVKYAANVAVGNAIRDGRLVKKPCEICGTTERVEAHHDDYSRPLDVRWLCFFHHRTVAHGQVVVAT